MRVESRPRPLRAKRMHARGITRATIPGAPDALYTSKTAGTYRVRLRDRRNAPPANLCTERDD